MAIAAICGMAVGLLLGLGVASIGEKSLAEVTAERDDLASQKTANDAGPQAAVDSRNAVSPREHLAAAAEFLASSPIQCGDPTTKIKKCQARGRAAIREVVAGQGYAARTFSSFQKKIKTGKEAQQYYRKRLRLTRVSDGEKLAESPEDFNAAKIAFQVFGSDATRGRRIFDQILQIQVLTGASAEEVAGFFFSVARLPCVNGLDNVTNYGVLAILGCMKEGASMTDAAALWATAVYSMSTLNLQSPTPNP